MKKIQYLLVALPILWVIGCTKNDKLEKEIAENSKKEVIEETQKDPKTDETKSDEGKTEGNSEDTSQNKDNTNQEGNTQSDENTITITFDTDGENTPEPIKVQKGATFITLPQPTRDNREFMGWTKKKDDLADFGPGAPLEEAQEDMTLYANWRIIDLNIGGASKNFKNQTVFLKGIDIPKESDWEVLNAFKKENLKTVPWKKGYKWYDTDQFTYSLCWAAGASNVIQWWLDQNAEYIKRYGKFDQPHAHNHSKDSDLFRFFRDNFEDRANRPDKGVLWYIKGHSSKKGAGFFKDVFEGKNLKRSELKLNKRNFTEMIDDALKNGKGMVFARDDHAVTAWGADFDKDGYVCGLYYVNSADSAKAPSGEVGLLHSEIIYKEINGQLKPCLPGSVDGYYTEIGELFTFSLGQDIWEEYLKKQEK